MFNNLKAEMSRKEITAKQIANILGITERAVTLKLNGTTDFKSSEMFKIKNLFFPECKIDYLFEND